MGQESEASLVRGRTRIAGRAYLEGDHLLFRGDGTREKLMLATVTHAKVSGESLVLTHATGTLRLHLPAATATKWVAKILNPPSRLDKLGVKEGMKVTVIGVKDADFHRELSERGAMLSPNATKGTEMIFFAAESPNELERLSVIREKLTASGAIWVVHRKGKEGTLKDVDVFAAAKRVGLVDTKVASFSATHTAEKLVIPVALRAAHEGGRVGESDPAPKTNTTVKATTPPAPRAPEQAKERVGK
ncbi:MAG: DUF3052 domain-containing protein [Gemmatimonadaceae bacterium]